LLNALLAARATAEQLFLGFANGQRELPQENENARFRLGQAIATELALEHRRGKQPMRRAGHKRPATALATPAMPSVSTRNAIVVADAPTDDELQPASETVSQVSESLEDREIRRRALEIAIHGRIETRLVGRVRNLHVRVFEGAVILEGQCATFYTKQLAQHAAMGILDDEHLENAIVVSVG
jgi:hypothetical protein